MKPIINLDETPQKIVGGRTGPIDPLSLESSRKEHMIAWRKAFGGLRLPKGVFRFSSHEEADEWMWNQITRPRKN